MITVIACIIGAMALICLGVACWCGWSGTNDDMAADRAGSWMVNYDPRGRKRRR
jgi:hypothetical protein